MNYVKGMLAGIAAAIVAVVLFLVVMLAIVNSRIDAPEGALVVAVIVRPDHAFFVAVMGFALGFWWSVRKQRRKSHA